MPATVNVPGSKMIKKFMSMRLSTSQDDDDDDIFFSSSISISSSTNKRRVGTTQPSGLKTVRSTPNLPQLAMEQTKAMPPLPVLPTRSRPNSADSGDSQIAVSDRKYPSLSYSATSESSSGSSEYYRRPRSVEDIVQWMDDRVLQVSTVNPAPYDLTVKDTRVPSKRWNTVSNRTRFDDPYALQHTLQEQDRMIAQHYLLRTAFKGCGPGTWTMELSTVFPRSTFIGIDINEDYPKQVKPKNCHFRKCNVVGDLLPFPDNSIGFIFQRDLNWGLQASDWTSLIQEYHRVLKPGGWIELIEPDIETQQSASKERLLHEKIVNVLSCRGQDPFVSRRLSSILATSGFRRVESRFQSLPLGWSGEIGKAYAHCYYQQLQALGGVVGSSILEDTIQTIKMDWNEFHAYVNWHSAVAQKPWTTRRQDATYEFL
ncbi:hypothetical protein NQZ79_g322 [Umbelopsis isabellina]|nr:hypothetical protein NQZ79_g322 [Umbelopsis isabellina]